MQYDTAPIFPRTLAVQDSSLDSARAAADFESVHTPWCLETCAGDIDASVWELLASGTQIALTDLWSDVGRALRVLHGLRCFQAVGAGPLATITVIDSTSDAWILTTKFPHTTWWDYFRADFLANVAEAEAAGAFTAHDANRMRAILASMKSGPNCVWSASCCQNMYFSRLIFFHSYFCFGETPRIPFD